MSGLWSLVIYDKRNTTNNLFAIHVYSTPVYIWLTLRTTNLEFAYMILFSTAELVAVNMISLQTQVVINKHLATFFVMNTDWPIILTLRRYNVIGFIDKKIHHRNYFVLKVFKRSTFHWHYVHLLNHQHWFRNKARNSCSEYYDDVKTFVHLIYIFIWRVM